MGKKVDGTKLLQEAKDKVNKNKQETTNMKKVISLTVLSTLTVLAIIAGMFYLGSQYGINYEKERTAEVHAQVQTLSKITASKE